MGLQREREKNLSSVCSKNQNFKKEDSLVRTTQCARDCDILTYFGISCFGLELIFSNDPAGPEKLAHYESG